MSNANLRLLALFMVVCAFAISLDLYIQWGSWFDMSDVHHETWILMFGFAGVLLFVLSGRKEKKA